MTNLATLFPITDRSAERGPSPKSGIYRRRPNRWRLAAAFRWFLRRACALLRRPTLLGSLGPYRLSRKIGEGGMGVIYEAIDPRSPRPVAIKVLPLERRSALDRARFEREARVTSLLKHPNTVSVYDYGKTRDGALYYVMEFLDGLDLQTLVEQEGPQPPARVAGILAELAGALAEVHALGLVHGDVKPANVVCCERKDGSDLVKMLDFGLARAIPGRPGESLAHPADAVAGTPLYLSPEALVTPGAVDGRSDLYALGALGYFLLTGVPPFTGKSALQVFTQHLHSTPVPPSERLGAPLPSALEDVILSCLSKEVRLRPASASELREALLPLARGWTSRPEGPPGGGAPIFAESRRGLPKVPASSH